MRDAREEPWPTMRITPGTPGKAKRGDEGAAALPHSPSADGGEVAWGLFVFAGLFDNVAERVVEGRKYLVCNVPATEGRHF